MKIWKGFLGIACAVITWELMLRAMVIHSPGFYNHPVLGRIPRAGPVLFSREGFARSHMNSLGMRGPELAPKQPGEVRILVVGDSLTQALHVPDEETFCERLRARLTRSLGRPVSVVNAGRPGASVAFYLHLAAYYTATVAPDYTILQLDDSDFAEEAFDATKSFRVVPRGGDFETVMHPGALDPALRRVSGAFPSIAALSQVEGLVGFSISRQAVQKLAMRMPDSNAKATNAAHHDGLVRWALPRLAAAYPRPTVLYLPTTGARRTETLVAEVARAQGLPLVTMRREFWQADAASRPPFGFPNSGFGRGHLNAHGHALVSTKLGDDLERRMAP